MPISTDFAAWERSADKHERQCICCKEMTTTGFQTVRDQDRNYLCDPCGEEFAEADWPGAAIFELSRYRHTGRVTIRRPRGYARAAAMRA